MKKLILLEIVILVICSVFVYKTYEKNSSFDMTLKQKEKILQKEELKLEQMDEEQERLLRSLEAVRNDENAGQLDLWRRRLDTLKEALY